MIRTQIQLTEEQSRKLKKIARTKDVSVAELIRRSVDRFLEAQADPSYEERKRRVLELAGKYASGVSDTSVHHDEYLADIYAGEGK